MNQYFFPQPHMIYLMVNKSKKDSSPDLPLSLKKILVIDDDPDILEAIQLMLEISGYQVFTDNGDQVEKKVSKFNPDLILLDVLLSGKDGRTICKKLKSKKNTKNIPVTLISAHADGKDSLACSGADDFLAKPFEMNHLLNLVEKYTS